MDISIIETNLRNTLENHQNVVIAIYGEWGVGKTYFYNNFIDKYCGQHKYGNIYISLIGKDNIDAIKEELLLKLAKRNGAIKVAQSIFSKMNSTLKIDDLSFGISTQLASVFNLLTKNHFNNQIICFDDVERMDMKILHNFFGLINELKEHKDCKIVLMLNDNKLMITDNFAKDKFIDKDISFISNIRYSFEIAKNSFENYLLDSAMEAKIFNYCNAKNIVNIRIIKRIIDDFIVFHAIFNNNQFNGIHRDILDVLVMFSAINAMKIKADLVRFYAYYGHKVAEQHNNSQPSQLDELFTINEMKEFEQYWLYMEKYDTNNNLISGNNKLHNITPIINNFIHTHFLSDEDKNKIINFNPL